MRIYCGRMVTNFRLAKFGSSRPSRVNDASRVYCKLQLLGRPYVELRTISGYRTAGSVSAADRCAPVAAFPAWATRPGPFLQAPRHRACVT